MQRLSGLDATFLHAESTVNHMHVMAAAVVDPSTAPGGFTVETLKALVEARLDRIPPFRRRLVPVPLDLDHPMWVEDPDLDLDLHVRRVALPRPGGPAELADLTADIAATKLDRRRPLWEIWYVDGVGDGLVGLVAKVHHAAIDGASGVEILANLLDLEARAVEQESWTGWLPERMPSDVELVLRSALDLARRPMLVAKATRRALRSAARVVQRLRAPEPISAAAPLTAPRTSLNAAIGASRKVAFADVAMADVRAVKDAFGATVNDIVLTACAGALRRWLDERGELPDGPLVAMVPANVRAEDERAMRNIVSAMFAWLPVEIDDPVERLFATNAAARGAKQIHELLGGTALLDLTEVAPGALLAQAVRLYSGSRLANVHRPVVNLIVSNVQGPPFPLYLGGAKLLQLFPLGPVFDGVALNITVMSYLDRIGFGMLACRETVPTVDAIARYVPDALAELVDAAGARTAAAG